MIKRGRHAFVDDSFGVFGFEGGVGYGVVTSYSSEKDNATTNKYTPITPIRTNLRRVSTTGERVGDGRDSI